MTLIPLTNSNQLPRWFWEPKPNQTLEQALADVRVKYPDFEPRVYTLGKRAFIEHPQNRQEAGR